MTPLLRPNVYLFFDTETTGIVERNQPPESSAQPDLVQLAAKLVTSEQEVRAAINVIIEPGGWKIPVGASNVHHITDDIALDYGIPRRSAMSVFSMLCKQATHGVAHNFDFDFTVVSAALHRERAQNRLKDLIPVCTMKAATPILRIPSKFKRGDWKWPKLDETYAYYFNGEKFDGAHDAMVDVDAMIRVFWEMKRRGEILPEVLGKAA